MWTQMTDASLGGSPSLGRAGLQALPALREVQADGCAGIAVGYVHVFEQRGVQLTISS